MYANTCMFVCLYVLGRLQNNNKSVAVGHFCDTFVIKCDFKAHALESSVSKSFRCTYLYYIRVHFWRHNK